MKSGVKVFIACLVTCFVLFVFYLFEQLPYEKRIEIFTFCQYVLVGAIFFTLTLLILCIELKEKQPTDSDKTNN